MGCLTTLQNKLFFNNKIHPTISTSFNDNSGSRKPSLDLTISRKPSLDLTVKENSDNFINLVDNQKEILPPIKSNDIFKNRIKFFDFDNKEDVKRIEDLICETMSIDISQYVHKHTLYFFVLTLKDKYILCKIGYTFDILQRLRDLRREYKCEFHLIGIKEIESEHSEKLFHKSIKMMCPEMYPKLKINGKLKEEVYYLNDKLINKFFGKIDKLLINTKQT